MLLVILFFMGVSGYSSGLVRVAVWPPFSVCAADRLTMSDYRTCPTPSPDGVVDHSTPQLTRNDTRRNHEN